MNEKEYRSNPAWECRVGDDMIVLWEEECGKGALEVTHGHCLGIQRQWDMW